MEGRKELFDTLRERTREIVNGSSKRDRDEKLRRICRLLRDEVPHYDWVGFYLVESSEPELVLGPFSGEPTEHARIKFGQGICGQAAEREETFTVQDVSKESNYLSCSPQVKSEIVVPIFKGEKIIGELDVDSHILSPFGKEDKKFLQSVSEIVSKLF